ncbi:MAG: chemotaxis protein chel [Silicimonas sp.]|nr:chemotaxis protein chel [Silicimonas sp.]
MSIEVSAPLTARNIQTGSARDPDLWKAARDLEAGFLAEMLKSAGVGEARKSFGGGAGEDQFSSFLVREYANVATDAGGIGLAESIYQSMLRSQKATT